MKKYLGGKIAIIIILYISCNSSNDTNAQSAEEPSTPVTITKVSRKSFSDTVELNAVSSFQLKTFVKATSNGYLQQVNARLGQMVKKGQTLFVVKTKEAQALGNTINALDSSFHFSGNIYVGAPGSGYITMLNYQQGDYVQDGEQLAVISDLSSFAFLMELPYELSAYLPLNKTVDIVLPDGTALSGTIKAKMPSVDSVAQTQSVIVHVNTNLQIPENLIAKVKLVKSNRKDVMSVPRQALLSDETQTHFWVMKVKDSITAVKLPVVKGLESANDVEIKEPLLNESDEILISGNYGLADTARITIQH